MDTPMRQLLDLEEKAGHGDGITRWGFICQIVEFLGGWQDENGETEESYADSDWREMR